MEDTVIIISIIMMLNVSTSGPVGNTGIKTRLRLRVMLSVLGRFSAASRVYHSMESPEGRRYRTTYLFPYTFITIPIFMPIKAELMYSGIK